MSLFKVALCSSVLLAAAFVCRAQAGGAPKRADAARLSAIQARLFYESTGTFSENVLTEKGFDLWNTPFDWTYATFVVVEVEGVPEYLARRRRIDLAARYVPLGRKRSVVLRQTEWIRNGSESGKAYAGFWLRDTGCEPVYLTARLAGHRRPLRATIQFGCGE